MLLPLLRLFAYVLQLDDEDFFVRRHRYEAEGLEYLRYMQYFPRSKEDDEKGGNIWARGHTDFNTLTFLFHQPVAGLQVLTPEGNWKYVRSPRDAVIVNIADALEFLSGGYLKSTVHRVVRPPADQADRPRLGLIYFARPEAKVMLEPVDSPLLRQIKLHRREQEEFSHKVTAEGMSVPCIRSAASRLLTMVQNGPEPALRRTTDFGWELWTGASLRLLQASTRSIMTRLFLSERGE